MDKEREDKKKRLGVRMRWEDIKRELKMREKQRDYRVFVCVYVSVSVSVVGRSKGYTTYSRKLWLALRLANLSPEHVQFGKF